MTSSKFTDEFNNLVKKLEELCRLEGIDFVSRELDEFANPQEVYLSISEWQDSGCSFEEESDSDYWQSSRC